jgi:hypothetical protein
MMERHMSRFTKDTNSIMGLTLSQIGLFLATGILLTAVFFLVFSSDWQRTAEIRSFASSFAHLVEDIDNRFFENTTRFQFPVKSYAYTVQLSTEYIVISAKGFWDTDLFVAERFLIQPWPRSSHQNWTTGEDLHEYLNTTCGHRGIKNDSISSVNFTQLSQEQNTTISFYALHPLEMLIREPVFLEKVTIFYDGEKKHDFLIVYQLI